MMAKVKTDFTVVDDFGAERFSIVRTDLDMFDQPAVYLKQSDDTVMIKLDEVDCLIEALNAWKANP